MKASDKKLLSRANNEKSYSSGGHLQRDGSAFPTSNAEIPRKHPADSDPKKKKKSRRTYQASFARKKCGGGILYKKCGGGKLKK